MKQLTFQLPTVATLIHPSGSIETVRFGHYESVMIVKENGWPVNRTKTLQAATIPVMEVELVDGSKIKFEVVPYCIEKSGYGE